MLVKVAFPRLAVAEATKVAASLALVAAGGHAVILDLVGLEFIDSSGLAALVHARQHARRAGSDLLLAAPRQQVLRMLAVTRLIDVFVVQACVDEAVGLAGRIPGAPAPRNPAFLATTSQSSRELLAAGDAA